MGYNRESITPMDYEWENSKGPVDASSPFITAANQHSIKKRKLNDLSPANFTEEQVQLELNIKVAELTFANHFTGPHSVLESPSKSFAGFNTPNRPHLREANSQPFYFSQNSKPLPAVPAHVAPDTWAPRTPTSIIDFSSGGETPNTPALNDDREAATPDTQMASRMGRLLSSDNDGRSKSPKKPSRRDSWFKTMFSSSPSPAKEDRKYYSKKAENRITKRRSKRTRELATQEEQDSPEVNREQNYQLGGVGKQRQNQVQGGYAANAASFFGWLEAHPDLPAVLTYYLQFVVNCCIGGSFVWIIYLVYSAIMADVDLESRKYINEAMVEISQCAKHYRDNRCDPETRVPAMETVCGNWESCMNRDARQVAKASVGARTFASILNSFVEQLSYKSLLFTAIVLFGGFNLSNWVFGVIRSKATHHPQHSQGDFYPPPATPHRQPSGGYIDQQGFYTPFATPYGSVNQHMLQHQAAQSMPALPAPPLEAQSEREESMRRSPRKKLFR